MHFYIVQDIISDDKLATEEDHEYEIDKWASLFKATTWEDIHMLINDHPTLQSAAETLYQLNMDEQLRETCDRSIRAEAREKALNRINAELSQANEALSQTNAKLLAENARLNALLAAHNNTEKE